MSFVNIDFTADADQLADDAVAYLQSVIPGWEPSDGHLEVWLIEALARMNSELAYAVREVPPQVFRAFGTQMLGINQSVGQRAAGLSTWVVESDQGWTIPAGTLVGYRTSGDSMILLETVTQVDVPAGSTSASGVAVRAVDVGRAANGIAPGTSLELVDSLSYVTSATVSSATDGGIDPESDASYLDRLSAEVKLLAPRPILASDFAVLAARIPGVHRGLGISGYDPEDGADTHERMVTVALVAADGTPVETATHLAVVEYLDSLREVNFQVHTIDPTYVVVNVAYSVHIANGYVAEEVIARVDDALAAVLSPSVWGGGDLSPAIWSAEAKVVRYFSLSNVIAAENGVAWVGSLTLNGAAADLTLTGIAPLPQPGTMTGTVA